MRKTRNPNLRLWICLSLVPIAITASVYFYGNSKLDSSIIKESDVNINHLTSKDNSYSEEHKVDIVQHVNKNMVLPTVETKKTKTTAKEDKRMLDDSGNMITVEIAEGETLEMLAEEKLGNSAFWVFFFDVNRDKLNTPTDVKPGMKLYLPNPEFFGFSSNDPGSIQYAKHRAEEIFKNK